MAEPRRFYKTVISYTVLSEEPIPPHVDLQYIAVEANEGRYVGNFGVIDESLLNGAAMAKALYEAGSDPGFFELDADGNDFDENDPERDFDAEKDEAEACTEAYRKGDIR